MFSARHQSTLAALVTRGNSTIARDAAKRRWVALIGTQRHGRGCARKPANVAGTLESRWKPCWRGGAKRAAITSSEHPRFSDLVDIPIDNRHPVTSSPTFAAVSSDAMADGVST